ncbi:MAG: hypothetical protein R3F34_15505 [Planctomycetota bacterium]
MEREFGQGTMNVEQEVIDQLCDDPSGWTMARIAKFIHDLGRVDVWELLESMWRAGHLEYFEESGTKCSTWEIEAHFRSPRVSVSWRVRATDSGVKWALGE